MATKSAALGELTAEDIIRQYELGRITVAERNKLLRAKTQLTVDQLLQEYDYPRVVFERFVVHLNEGWKNVVAAAKRDPTFDVGTESYYALLAMWGIVQMMVSGITALGETNGAVAERFGLATGLQPGAARVLRIAVDLGTGFVPITKAAQKFVTGLKESKITAPLLPKVAEEAAPKAVASVAPEAVAQAKTAIKEGIRVEIGEEAAKKIEGVAETIPKIAKKELVETPKVESKSAVMKRAKSLTREKITEEIKQLSESMGVDPGDIGRIIGRKKLSQEEMYTYLVRQRQHAEQLNVLARAALRGGEAEGNAFMRATIELFTDAPIQDPNRLRITKQYIDLLKGWDPENMAKGDIGAAIRTLAQDIVAMTKPPSVAGSSDALAGAAAMLRLRSREDPTFWEKAREVYVNMLLPFAWAPTFIGNTSALGINVMERAVGAMFSTSKTTGLVNKEALYQTKGTMLAIGDGLRAFGNAYKRLEPGEVSRLDYIPGTLAHGAVGGPLGPIIRVPTATVRGMDNFFKVIAARGVYYAAAIREAEHLGLRGAEAGRFIQSRVMLPTEATMREAAELANTVSMQSDLGRFGRLVQQTVQTGPGVLYFPFMRAPINLAKFAWHRTPGLNLISKQLYKDIAEGGVKADMAVGRLSLAYMQAWFIFELAREGYITGHGPVDPALNRRWRATHEQYSVKTPSGWIPLSHKEPANTPIGMIADIAEIIDSLDELQAEQVMAAVAFAIMENFGNLTWWGAFGEIINAIQDVARGGPVGPAATRAILAPVTTVLTGGPLGTRARQIADPGVIREARSYVDMLRARTPGFSQEMPPRRDGYGDVAVPPQEFGGPWFGLLRPIVPAFRPFETDRIKREGNDLEVRVPFFPWHIGGGRVRDDFDIRQPFPEDKLAVELTPWQRDDWQELYRRALRDPQTGIEATLLNTERYKNAPRALKRQLFEGALRDYYNMARELLLVKHPDLGREVIRRDFKSILPLLDDQQRIRAEEQLHGFEMRIEYPTPQQIENLNRYWTDETERR